jgi:xanthine dehydrogenase YagR molybdenum-binding subunit
MKFEHPATFNPIDQLKVIGRPTSRIDGPMKTTGTAPYAYERHDVVANQAYGYVIGSAIAKGRIAAIDLAAAKAAPGVLAIITSENAGKLEKGERNAAPLLGGPEIAHYHQAVAVVVAETFEEARAAAQLAMDPVALRIKNDTQVDREHPERRFSQRQLARCLTEGAERFGWDRRNPRPGQVRDGRWLVGMGVAAAFRNNLVARSAARVRLDAVGTVAVETDMTDIGTGSYTIIAQTAAEMMGVPLEKVAVRLGDSNFPVSCGSGGQWGGNNSTAGVYAACVKLRDSIAQKLGFNSEEAMFSDGMVRAGNRSVPLAQAAGQGSIMAEDAIEYGDLAETYQQSTFGAHFVEVGVDADTAEVRVRRMLAVCAAGRILNPKAARSQVIGAMTMGVGAALMEELVVDKRHGYFVNHDLAGYEVPVHADIPHQDMIFLDETDPMSSPMKAKGVAELGICGVAAAVANAIYNAAGVRVRDYPITLDKLLKRMPDMG